MFCITVLLLLKYFVNVCFKRLYMNKVIIIIIITIITQTDVKIKLGTIKHV